MATHSSILAWKLLWMEEPGGLQSMGSLRVGHDWSDLAAAVAAYIYHFWRQPVILLYGYDICPFLRTFRLFLIFSTTKKFAINILIDESSSAPSLFSLGQTPKSKIPESKGMYIFKGFIIRPHSSLRIIWKTCIGLQQHANDTRSLKVAELHLKVPLITHLLRISELGGPSRLITSVIQYILTDGLKDNNLICM